MNTRPRSRLQIHHTPEDRERRLFKLALKAKTQGMSGFVARPNGGRGASRFVLLVGSNGAGWHQAVKCWHGNHKERAEALAAQYNAAPAKQPKPAGAE